MYICTDVVYSQKEVDSGMINGRIVVDFKVVNYGLCAWWYREMILVMMMMTMAMAAVNGNDHTNIRRQGENTMV